uniref:PDZ and LIM domain protein 3 isoform X3 n=1 Tax=Myxine glutinosa TaxID=7769 RepID=UPI00358F081F
MRQQIKLQGSAPWGFRLTGGRDLEQPLVITRVTPNSLASEGNLRPGDAILAISDHNAEEMTHAEAQDAIKACGGQLVLLIDRPESVLWSPNVVEEGMSQPYKMSLASEPQAALHVGSTHNRKALPFPGSQPAVKVEAAPPPGLVCNKAEGPCPSQGLEKSLQDHCKVVETGGSTGSQTEHLPSHHGLSQDSEAYKLRQENLELGSAPRQSGSFQVLQAMLDEENGGSDRPTGIRSVKAPIPKIGAVGGETQKLPVCSKCGTGIMGQVVKARDHMRHPECFVCGDCGMNLKQKGFFFVEDQLFCEMHARARSQPPPGYELITTPAK